MSRLDLFSTEAEMAVLGGLLQHNDAYPCIKHTMRPEYFSEPLNGEIYVAATELIEAGKRVTDIVLNASLKGKDTDEGFKLSTYIKTLYERGFMASPKTLLPAYVNVLREYHTKRDMDTALNDCLGRLHTDTETEAGALLDASISDLARIQRQGVGQSSFATTQDAVEALFDTKAPRGISTGFAALDKYATFPRGGITLLGGRASMGKSALLIEFAFSAARRGFRVDLFSMEMSRAQIASRAISSEIARKSHNQNRPESIPYQRIAEGNMPDGEMRIAKAAAAALPKINFDDTPRLTVSDIKARCAEDSAPMDLVFIDYLNIMSLADCDKSLRHDQKLGYAASRLRDFARDTGAAVVLLCQLNRGNTSRDNNVPQIQDLRDSGELEQHADTVFFVHREHYYRKRALEAEQAAGKRVADTDIAEVNEIEQFLDVIIAKQRMGAIGKAFLQADMKYNYIRDWPKSNSNQQGLAA